ncbi:MAG TPA: flagellar biosynthesis anti-sigma factor FlgM [Paenibacillaceae bacterium]
MKIDETRSIGMRQTYGSVTSRRIEGIPDRKRVDEVHISEEAKRLLDAREAQQTERIRKIEALRQEVASGTYYVESGKIAEKLLPFLLE